ncbi:MAG: chemotaxis protein [Rhodocyclaceae bacterium]|nr:chemotaxis protein [Rhodocyclaceae bacterium]
MTESTVGEGDGRGRPPSGSALDLLRIVRINEEIKRVVAVAFKINIMALNAIFLAKRAGNAALGFGVLSNELRVFSKDLHESMMTLTRLIHESVAEVSVILQESRQDELFRRTAAEVPDDARLAAVLERRAARHAECAQRIAALRRELRMAVEDAARLVELGGVLAKSAKIEAAYGAGFAASLGQVSGEFDGIVEEIRSSLDKLRHSSFFGGSA